MAKKRVVLVEGPNDRVTIKALQAAGLVSNLEPSEAGGEARLAPRAVDYAEGGLDAVVVVHDLDKKTPTDLARHWGSELGTCCAERKLAIADRGQEWVLRSGDHETRVRLVPAGASLTEVAGFSLAVRALDDLLFQLVVESRQAVESLGETDRVSHELAVHKLEAVSKLLADQGIRVDSSKRLLHLFRGITGFRASPATYAGRIIEKAAPVDMAALQRIYGPFCAELQRP